MKKLPELIQAHKNIINEMKESILCVYPNATAYIGHMGRVSIFLRPDAGSPYVVRGSVDEAWAAAAYNLSMQAVNQMKERGLNKIK